MELQFPLEARSKSEDPVLSVLLARFPVDRTFLVAL
jgi:hypothetical protein